MTISEPTQLNLELSILFAADSPVRTSQQQGSKQASKKARDRACSLNSCESFAWFDPDTLLWKTSQRCLLMEWTSYSGSFPKAGTMQNGQLFHAPMWAVSTFEKGSGLLPTPTASDTLNRRPGNPHTTKNGTIRHVNAEGHQSFMRLSQVVQLLPTPRRTDFKGAVTAKTAQGCLERGYSPNLPEYLQLRKAGLLPTPTTRDWKHGSAAQVDKPRSEQLNDRCAAATGKTRLNPVFVEMMMGYPQGWTDLT